jgi:hypothetical protein
MDLQIEELMEELVQAGGSDLHLAAGQPPYGRFSGQLKPIREQALSEDVCNRLIFSMINNAQRKQLEQTEAELLEERDLAFAAAPAEAGDAQLASASAGAAAGGVPPSLVVGGLLAALGVVALLRK